MKIAIQTLVKSAMLYVLEQEHGRDSDQHELNERLAKYYSAWLCLQLNSLGEKR
jgi:hypothetical protein